MDPTPAIPPVTVDEAGTVRVGGRYPATPSLARERAGQLMWKVEDAHGAAEVTHAMYGTMPTACAALLADALWRASYRVVCAGVLPADVLATLVPDPEQPANGEGAPLAHLPELGGEG
jgi:hypothetical protein